MSIEYGYRDCLFSDIFFAIERHVYNPFVHGMEIKGNGENKKSNVLKREGAKRWVGGTPVVDVVVVVVVIVVVVVVVRLRGREGWGVCASRVA